jgi:hypothetical protein
MRQKYLLKRVKEKRNMVLNLLISRFMVSVHHLCGLHLDHAWFGPVSHRNRSLLSCIYPCNNARWSDAWTLSFQRRYKRTLWIVFWSLVDPSCMAASCTTKWSSTRHHQSIHRQAQAATTSTSHHLVAAAAVSVMSGQSRGCYLQQQGGTSRLVNGHHLLGNFFICKTVQDPADSLLHVISKTFVRQIIDQRLAKEEAECLRMLPWVGGVKRKSLPNSNRE